MSKRDKLIKRILDLKEVSFQEAVTLLEDLGYKKRVVGSHHLFSKPGVDTVSIKFREPIHKDAVRDLRKVVEREI